MGSNIPKIGTSDIVGCYVGDTEIEKVYLGDSIIYEKSVTPTELIGYTTVGTITDNGGLISNFSATNYAVLPERFDPQGEPFEINIRLHIHSDPSNGYYNILGSDNSSWTPAFFRRNVDQYGSNLKTIGGDRNGYSYWYTSGDGNFASYLSYPADINYNLTGSGTSLYLIKVDINGVTAINKNQTVTYATDSMPSLLFRLGASSGSYSKYLTGNNYIDLNHCYINKSGVRWWSGVQGAN